MKMRRRVIKVMYRARWGRSRRRPSFARQASLSTQCRARNHFALLTRRRDAMRRLVLRTLSPQTSALEPRYQFQFQFQFQRELPPSLPRRDVEIGVMNGPRTNLLPCRPTHRKICGCGYVATKTRPDHGKRRHSGRQGCWRTLPRRALPRKLLVFARTFTSLDQMLDIFYSLCVQKLQQSFSDRGNRSSLSFHRSILSDVIELSKKKDQSTVQNMKRKPISCGNWISNGEN